MQLQRFLTVFCVVWVLVLACRGPLQHRALRGMAGRNSHPPLMHPAVCAFAARLFHARAILKAPASSNAARGSAPHQRRHGAHGTVVVGGAMQ